MNKIKFFKDEIKSSNLDDSIVVDTIPRSLFFDVTTINITVKKDTTLSLEYNTKKPTKLNVQITVEKDAHLVLNEYRYGTNFKIQYQYFLMSNTNTEVYKFYDVKGIKEMDIIYLEEEHAKINYYFKTLSTGCEKYSMRIYHNAKNTSSNINNCGVNILKGNLIFNISSFVTEGNIECEVLQNSRIINLTDNKVQINPNLFIDEYNVVAEHSANIGTFNDQELFYLMSRGLDAKTSENLLINGLMSNNMPNDLANKIRRNLIKYRG